MSLPDRGLKETDRDYQHCRASACYLRDHRSEIEDSIPRPTEYWSWSDIELDNAILQRLKADGAIGKVGDRGWRTNDEFWRILWETSPRDPSDRESPDNDTQVSFNHFGC